MKIDFFFYILSINCEILIKFCICFDVQHFVSRLRQLHLIFQVFSTELCPLLYVKKKSRLIFHGGVSCMPAALLFDDLFIDFTCFSVNGYACISYTGVGVPDTLGKILTFTVISFLFKEL